MQYDAARRTGTVDISGKSRRADCDWPFALTVLLLLGIGVTMVLSSSIREPGMTPAE